MFPPKKSKLDTEMTEKTPVSLLQELTIGECEQSPFFEFVPNDEDPKAFSCFVQAFGQSEIGSGRSKKEAKHEASANLIAKLRLDKRYSHKLPVVPPTPRPVSDSDAVGRLLDICVQRNWPLAEFVVTQASGEPHRPEFTVICSLASVKRVGRYSTKKSAKQLAAQAMLDVVQRFPETEDRQQLARIDVEPAEKTFRTYCDLKKNDIKHIPIRLRDRHKYLLNFPPEERQEVFQILMRDPINTARNKIDLVCKALKLKYNFKDVPNHPTHQMFVLEECDYDCVLIEQTQKLSDRVVEHFKTMMNFQMC